MKFRQISGREMIEKLCLTETEELGMYHFHGLSSPKSDHFTQTGKFSLGEGKIKRESLDYKQ